MSSDITSYGGDATVVATRAEIDRVMAELGGIAGWLRGQVDLEDFLVETIPVSYTHLTLPTKRIV